MDAPEPGRRRRFAAIGAAARFHALPLLGLLLVAAAPFVPAMLRGETPFFLDLADHWFPIRLAAWHARQSGELAQWCGNVFCGIPLLAQVEAGLAYPPHFVTDLIHPAYTLLPQIVLHRFVAGVLTYAALRLRGASRTASFFGGAVLVLCGFTTNAVSQLAVLRTIVWLPALLIASHYLTRGRLLVGALWTAAGAGIVMLAGYAPFLQRAGLLVPFLILGDPAFPKTAAQWRGRLAACAAAAAGLALAVGLGAAQLVPSALSSQSQRALGLDPGFADGLRAAPADLLMIVAPRFTVDGGVVRQGFAYVGLIPLCLGVLAVVRRRVGARAFAAAAAFALVAALGAQTPLGTLLLHLPMASSFRNPTQYLAIWWLAVPVLSAMGLDAWIERRPDAREIAWCVAPVAACLVLGAIVPAIPTDFASRMQLAAGAAAIVGVLVAWRVASRPVAMAILVAVATADAGSLAVRYMLRPDRSRPTATLFDADAPLERVARHHAASKRDEPARVITSDSDQHLNWDNHVVVAGLDNVRGLMSLIPIRALDLSRIVAEGAPFERRPTPAPLYDYGPTHALESPLLDLLAVRYAVGFPDSPGQSWTRIGPEEWERDSVPAARLVPRVVVAPRDGDGWRRLVEPGLSPRTTAVVESDIALPSADDEPGTVRFAARGPNSQTMDVDARRDAVLLWSETGDAGWTAEVDGTKTEILRANHAHMAVVVRSGRHSVTWRYEAPGRRTGAVISLASLVVFAGLIVWGRLRSA